MLDLASAGAVVPTAPKLGVERVEDLRIERTDLDCADKRANVLVDVGAVPAHGARAAGVHVKVSIQRSR